MQTHDEYIRSIADAILAANMSRVASVANEELIEAEDMIIVCGIILPMWYTPQLRKAKPAYVHKRTLTA